MVTSLAMLVAIFAPITAIIKAIKERITPFRAVLNGVLTGIVGALVVMVIGQIMGVNAFDEMLTAADATIKSLTSDPEVLAALGEDITADQLTETLDYIYATAVKILPATLCIMSLFASYIEYIILSKIMRPDGLVPIPMTKIQEFDLPRKMVTVWCLIYLIVLCISNTEAFADNIVLLNLMLLCNMAFVFQGISVIFMFCHTRRFPRAVAAIFTILLMCMSIGPTLIRLLGFTDLLFGLKFRMKQKV